MAAPGIQLNSTNDFELFHPSIQEYVHGVEKAAASGDLAGAQAAFAALSKAAHTVNSLRGHAGTPHSLVQSALEAAGAALKEGDLAQAGNILSGLRQGNPASSGTSQDSGQDAESAAAQNVAQDESGNDQGSSESASVPNLNVQA